MKISLTKVPEINYEKLEMLKPLWVYSVNQVYSFANVSPWREYLEEILGNDLTKILNFGEKILSIGEKTRLRMTHSRDEYSFGAKLGESNELFVGSPSRSDMKIKHKDNLPERINWIWKIPQIHVRNQANRGTCVAFTVSAVNEFLHYNRSRFDYLSPQFLYYECKVRDNDNDAGTWTEVAMNALLEVGEPREVTCPYNPFQTNDERQEHPSQESYDEAKYYKITKIIRLNPKSVTDIKKELLQQRLVAISIPIYASWYTPGDQHDTGEFTMPLPNEKTNDGHAVCVVGYQDVVSGDEIPPGGGYFIIRNSWGESWASQNVYAPGYGLLPYAYIEKYGMESFSASL